MRHWTEGVVRQLSPSIAPKRKFESISFAQESYTFEFHGSPAEFADLFRKYYGPTMNAFEAADKSGHRYSAINGVTQLARQRIDQPEWTRRNFVQAGLAASAAVALGACAHSSVPRGSTATGSATDLNYLAQRMHGRFLLEESPGYDEARKVWNLAYDRHPLAMARCSDIDDVRRCEKFARRHSVPDCIRGGGHSFAGFGVSDGALQVDLGAFTTVTVDQDRRVASVKRTSATSRKWARR